MNHQPLLSLAVFFFALLPAGAIDLKNRSNSASGQFTIYCDDRELRGDLSTLAEDTKTALLKIFHEHDAWKLPIVITARDETRVPSRVNLTSGYGISKIDVVISADRKNLPEARRRIIEATLLERALRGNDAAKAGSSFHYPPWWMVEGLHEMLVRSDGGNSVEILKNILHTAKMPALEKILAGPRIGIEESLADVDRASAMCLVEALIAQENGSQALLRFLESWVREGSDPLEKLSTHFPALGTSGKNLGKWWSIQLARVTAGDNIESLSLAETDRQLSRLLSLDVVVDKKGRHEAYALADFKEYLRFPGAGVALKTGQVRLAALGTKAHPIFRPVFNGYSRVFGALLAKKTKRVAQEIEEIESYRQTVLVRMNDTTDYLNWFQASQPSENSAALEKYLAPPKNRPETGPALQVDPRITRYLDGFEGDFSPRN